MSARRTLERRLQLPLRDRRCMSNLDVADLERNLFELEQKLKRNEFDAAVQLAQGILRAAPENSTATRLFGAALRGSGRYAEAVDVLGALAEREPGDALVQNSLGAVRKSMGDIDGACAAFERACKLAPDLPPLWYNYAITLFMRDEVEAGLHAIDRAIELAPAAERIRFTRSEMLREQGRMAQVTAEYRAALARQPDSPWSWFGISNLKNVPMSEEDIRGVRRALLVHRDEGPERTALLFALAKALEDNEHFDEALSVLAQASAGKRAGLKWDADAFSHHIEALLDTFSIPLAGSSAQQGREVIFIVSPPRSGSTLLEQIIASHSQVTGGGEIDAMRIVLAEENNRCNRSTSEWAKDATPQDWQRLGQRYLEVTAAHRQLRPRFTDKSLGNWWLVGAIRAMLPAATIIVCRRDPVETLFSCYRQLFHDNGHPYSYDLRDLAAYWRDFDRACTQWKRLHPDHVFDLVYEDLIREQESQTRELLAHCGLEFEPACLQFFATQRKISTISAAQVREPLRRDTARAARYGALLDPLRAALGVLPSSATANS